MRITAHGNDLLVTDQSLGLGAFLVALGTFGLVATLSALIDGNALAPSTAFYALGGAWAVWYGLHRLVATQLIIDPDEQTVAVKRWTIGKATSQRIPLTDLDRFAIEPEEAETKTHLVVYAKGDKPPMVVGLHAHRAAWEEIITAINEHLKGKPG
ncbi:MAG: hypothetical protein ACFB01_09690 [Cohaesibacteraceae bacterium]